MKIKFLFLLAIYLSFSFGCAAQKSENLQTQKSGDAAAGNPAGEQNQMSSSDNQNESNEVLTNS